MADEKLRIVIEAVDKASAELKKVSKEMGGMDENIKKSTNSFENFSKAMIGINQGLEIAAKLAQAAKKTFEFAESGAQIEFMRDKFDNLAVSIGTTGDVLEEKLSVAINGMMSDAEGMALATDLMSLGLAKTEDQAIRLTTVASQLGMDMNQLTLTLSNKTTMRFDSLGVSIDGFDDRLKTLKATGMDTNEAFTEAFLQQAEKQIITLGDAADSAIAPYKELTTTIKNLTDGMKVLVNDGAGPVISTFNDLFGAYGETISVINMYTEAEEKGYITTKEKNKYIRQAIFWNYEYVDTIKDIEAASRAVAAAEGDAMLKRQAGMGIIPEVIEAEKQLTEEMQKQIEERNKIVTSYNQTRLKDIETINDLEVKYTEDITEARLNLATVQAEIDAKRKQGYSDQGRTMQELLAKEDELIAKVKEVQDAHDLATKEIILGYLEQKMAADGILTDDEMMWLANKRVEWGLWEQTSITMLDSVLGQVDNFYNQVNGLVATVRVDVQYNNSGLNMNQLPTGLTDYGASNYSNKPIATGSNIPISFQAEGGDYLVNKPTLFMAGEAGLERATFTPGGGNSAGSTVNNFYITESGNARNTAKEVARELRLQGVAL